MLVLRIANHPDRLGPSDKICPDFHKTDLTWSYRESDQVQYSVVASRAANQSWSKGLDVIDTAELKTANVACLKNNYPDFMNIQIDRSLYYHYYYYYY
jgi:hypothetical protein